MATKNTSPFLSGNSGSVFQQRSVPKSNALTLDDLLRQNDSSRQKLSEAGYDDPTREVKPSVLERIFGPLDALGTGVRGLVYNAVSDKNVDVWQEMGKALKGEDRVEGADILEELGVDNKTVQMLGGFLADMLLDPTTYITLGYGAAAKAGGKGLLRAVATAGTKIDDVARIAGVSDDVARAGVAALKSKGLIDDAGKLIADWATDPKIGNQVLDTLSGVFNKGGVKFAGISLGGADKVADAQRAVKGAVKLDAAGNVVSRSGLRALPGAKFLEGAFGTPGELGGMLDTLREGNEAYNAMLRAVMKSKNGRMALGRATADRAADALSKTLGGDERLRSALTVVMSQQFSDEALSTIGQHFDDITRYAGNRRRAVKDMFERAGVNTSKLEGDDAFEQVVDEVLKKADDIRQSTDELAAGLDNATLKSEVASLSRRLGANAKRASSLDSAIERFYNYDGALQQALGGIDELRASLFDPSAIRRGLGKYGFSEEQIRAAEQAAESMRSQFSQSLDARKAVGLDAKDFMGQEAGSEFYLPGMESLTRTKKEAASRVETLKSLGIDTDLMQPVERDAFRRSGATAAAQGAKQYSDPLRRSQGISMDDLLKMGREDGDGAMREIAAKVGGKDTEFDAAELLRGKLTKDSDDIALKQMSDELVSAVGEDEAKRIIDSTSKFFIDDESTRGFLRAFDKVTNTWKTHATVLRFPAFSNRNGITNKVMMWQEGMLSAAGEDKSLGLISRMMKKNLTDADLDFMDELVEHGVLTSFGEMSEQVGKQTQNRVVRALGKLNELVENQSRVSAYVTATNKGLGKQAASEMVNRSLLDYSDEALSVFERSFMKRITPFYKWTKGNLSKQTRLLFESPGKSTWLGHLMESGGAAADIDTSDMPEWLRELNPIQTPLTFRGNPVMISTEGLFPQNDLELIGKVVTGEMNANDALSFLSPLLRTPLEIVMNKDVYYDEDLQAYAGEKKRAPGYIEEFGDIANAVPGLREAWGLLTNALDIQERTGKDGEDYYWMDARAVKVMKDALPWMNQVAKYVGGADPDKTVLDRWSATGVKPIKYDTEQFAQNKAYEDRDALMDALAKMRDEATAKPGLTLQDIFGGR